MTKYLSIVVAILVLCCCSCNHHNEPPTEVKLPIDKSFLPSTVQFNRSDTEFLEKCREWNNKLVRVDSPDELPNDPLGFSEIYRNLNFKNQTLLLYYDLHFWEIKSCDYTFHRNTVEKKYIWLMSLGVVDIVFEGDEKPETSYFTRFAILVRKLPEDAEISAWNSIDDLDNTFQWFE